MKKVSQNESVWYRKYRPRAIDDVILPKEMKETFKKYIENEDFPHILLSSPNPGTGKSSLSFSIVEDLNADVKVINGSQDNGIDTFREEVKHFITSGSLDDSKKIVLVDECLEENECIKTPNEDIKLKDMEIGKIYECYSYNKKTNKVEKDTCEIISDNLEDVYEIEFNDGRTVKLTETHPLIVKTIDNKIIKKSIKDGISESDEIIDFYDLVFDNNEEIAKEIKVKIPKYQAEVLEKSNINLQHLLRGFLDVIIEEQLKNE